MKTDIYHKDFELDSVKIKSEVDPKIRSDEGLTLETSASVSLHGGNLTLIDLFDNKFSFSTSLPTQHHSFFRN